jgi:1,2-phenylacetyl-CoA epoxidase catalytic subunit
MRAVVGTYWPKRKDAAEQALGMAALSLDEAGRAWLFVRHDGDLVGFVL